MNELAILGLLKDQDMHGYELRKQLGELTGSRATMSFGSLYPALGRLERAGYVKAVTSSTTRPATPPSPMSGSLAGELAAFRAQRRAQPTRRGGRGKKVYGLTDQGAARLHELLVEPDVSDDRDFALRLTFFLTLSPTERLALFRHRRDVLLRRRDERRQVAGSGRLNRYLRSFIERDTETITADLDWLDRMIATEQAAVDPDDTPSAGGTTDERERNR